MSDIPPSQNDASALKSKNVKFDSKYEDAKIFNDFLLNGSVSKKERMGNRRYSSEPNSNEQNNASQTNAVGAYSDEVDEDNNNGTQ